MLRLTAALTLTKSCLTPEFSMYTPIFGSETKHEQKTNTKIYSLKTVTKEKHRTGRHMRAALHNRISEQCDLFVCKHFRIFVRITLIRS